MIVRSDVFGRPVEWSYIHIQILKLGGTFCCSTVGFHIRPHPVKRVFHPAYITVDTLQAVPKCGDCCSCRFDAFLLRSNLKAREGPARQLFKAHDVVWIGHGELGEVGGE